MNYRKILVIFTVMIMMTVLAACSNTQNESAQSGSGNGNDNHGHEHNEGLIEWRGVYELEAGAYELSFENSDDPSMMIGFFDKSKYTGKYDIDDAHHAALHLFEKDLEEKEPGSSLEVENNAGYKLILNSDGTCYELEIPEEGAYVVFTQHVPAEFNMQIAGQDGNIVEPDDVKEYAGDHDHGHEHEDEDHDHDHEGEDHEHEHEDE